MLKGLERLSTHPAVIPAIVTGIATIGAGWITSRFSEDQLEANLIIEAVVLHHARDIAARPRQACNEA